MKSLIIAASGAFALAFAGTALADHHGGEKMEMSEAAKEFKAGCKAYQEENGGNTDCKCLAKKYDKDEDFAAAMMSVMGPEDVEALSDEHKETIAKCDMKDEMKKEKMESEEM